MRTRGSILLVLLIMLLFASMVLLQLSEDNYVTHLIAKHLDNLSAGRQALQNSFKQISFSSTKNQACFSAENDKNALDAFWSVHSCQLNSSGKIVNYAFQVLEQEKEELRYMQYTLRVKSGLTYVWLRVVVADNSNLILSWTYYL